MVYLIGCHGIRNKVSAWKSNGAAFIVIEDNISYVKQMFDLHVHYCLSGRTVVRSKVHLQKGFINDIDKMGAKW